MENKILKGISIVFCAVLIFGMLGCKPEVHVHTFSTDWESNPEYHWHKATCEHSEEVSDRDNHVWNHEEYQYDSESGKEIRTCTVCKYVDAKDHEHTEDSDSGTVTKTATINSVGVITYKCSVCKGDARKELYCGPLGEDGKAASLSSTYVYFGVFPRTVKEENIKVDETEKIIMGRSRYYKGDDGEWYAKAKVYPDEYLHFPTYSDGTTIEKGKEYYFKVEPIKWKVLTTDYNNTKRALLLAEEILKAKSYYYGSYKKRTINGKSVYRNNYEFSEIRAYLNGKYEYDDAFYLKSLINEGFLQKAFIPSAQTLISDTIVVNNGASTSDATGTLPKADGTAIESGSVEGGDVVYYQDYTSDNTTDKIFLLSEEEVTTIAYGFSAYDEDGSGNARIRVATDYSIAEGAGNWWWLRSPYYKYNYSARYVDPTGGTDRFTASVSYKRGVVPALTISF